MKDSTLIGAAVQALFEMVEEGEIELTSSPIEIERDSRPHGFGTWSVTLHGHIDGNDVDVCLVLDSVRRLGPNPVTGFRRDWAGESFGNWTGCDEIERRFAAAAPVFS